MVNRWPRETMFLDVPLAVEAAVAHQFDVLHPQLLQAVKDEREYGAVGHASRKLGVPQRGVRGMGAQKPQIDLRQPLMVHGCTPVPHRHCFSRRTKSR
jgi:hypothetical protein